MTDFRTDPGEQTVCHFPPTSLRAIIDKSLVSRVSQEIQSQSCHSASLLSGIKLLLSRVPEEVESRQCSLLLLSLLSSGKPFKSMVSLNARRGPINSLQQCLRGLAKVSLLGNWKGGTCWLGEACKVLLREQTHKCQYNESMCLMEKNGTSFEIPESFCTLLVHYKIWNKCVV